MSHFKPNRSLLNPKFEGYKLSPLAQEEIVFRYGLQYKPSQSNVSGRSHITIQEVQSRISHNHLIVSAQNGRMVYIDSELRVISVRLDEATLEPSFDLLYELPTHLLSPEAGSLQREYPSAAFLDPSLLFVSDGHGYLYVLHLSGSGPAELLGTFELAIPPAYGSSVSAVPFRIHQAVMAAPQDALVILSSKHYSASGSSSAQSDGPSQSRAKHSSPEFDIWAVQFTLPLPPLQEQTQPLVIFWHRRGKDVPVYTAYDDGRKAFLLIGGSSYHSIDIAPTPAYEPSVDELVPIPRADEKLDGAQPQKPPPYSWTQTPDSVTVAIPLPSSTRKEDIRVNFTPRTLTVFIRDGTAVDSDNLSDGAQVRPPRYDMKALWDDVQPSTSFWTWDRAAEHTFGVLTLHIDKAHEGTRWMQVFAAAGSRVSAPSPNTSDEDIEVPETLDPSELWAIREALEKYTTALRDGQDSSGLGLGGGVPSLAKDEVDDELDLGVGRSVCLTWVRADGSSPPYGDDAPVQLLSVLFPGLELTTRPSLVLKNGLDGVLYELSEGAGSEGVPVWTHTSTYSALSFVLASKQDTRFTHHLSSQAVFAFESGSHDLGGNVYIYQGAQTQAKWAKQALLKVGGASAGSLLGLGMTRMRDGRTVIMCLCEDEFIVLHGAL